MIRNVVGAFLALVGAAAAVWSPFRAWYDGRHGRDVRVADLFEGISAARADLWTSLLLPFVFAALVTLVGLVLRSRLLVALAGVVVLGFTVLWMVRQGQAAGGLSVDSDGSGLGLGVAMAAGGGVLLLLAAAVMSGRPRHGVHRRPHEDGAYGEPYDRHPYADEPQPGPAHPDPYGQRPYADDAPTAEYPPVQDPYGRPGDEGGGHGYGPEAPGRGPDPGPGPDDPGGPTGPHRGRF
ncbi:hypothetical protein [Streptomyces sp. NPDC015131]|uniref:hypothetical protein n=1 Tax=Streptomyces sp. NPDC015131 TaxID=3364941 RepID=UPI0036FEDF52